MSELEPLPQAVLTADMLRRTAADLILQAEALEASAGFNKYRPTRYVEYEFSKKRPPAVRPQRNRKKRGNGNEESK